MADDVHAPRIDGDSRRDLVDQAGQVRAIVDAGPVEVAARVGRVPEAVALPVERPLGVGVDDAPLVGERVDAKVRLEVRG
jgi:hypothetical protein